jgi:hypothetical protein
MITGSTLFNAPLSPPLIARFPSRPHWAWWGVAGVLGFIATVLTDPWASIGEKRLSNGGADAVVSSWT